MKEKRADPLRGSGLGLGALWLSRGERAALDELGDVAERVWRRGFLHGWRQVLFQWAMAAAILLPRVGPPSGVLHGESLLALEVMTLSALVLALLFVVDCVQARSLLSRGRLEDLATTPVPAASLASCLVLPQRLALRGLFVVVVPIEILAAAIVLWDAKSALAGVLITALRVWFLLRVLPKMAPRFVQQCLVRCPGLEGIWVAWLVARAPGWLLLAFVATVVPPSMHGLGPPLGRSIGIGLPVAAAAGVAWHRRRGSVPPPAHADWLRLREDAE